jgi:hypothetical protein
MRTLVVVALLVSSSFLLAGDSGAKKKLAGKRGALIGGRFVPLLKGSVIYHSKKKASDTRWVRLPCKHCHGTGHAVMVINKGNTSVRLLKPCPWCGGSGTRGLSKL